MTQLSQIETIYASRCTHLCRPFIDAELSQLLRPSQPRGGYCGDNEHITRPLTVSNLTLTFNILFAT